MTGQSDTADLPPSAKLVGKILEEEGPSSFDRVVTCTRLPRETARYAVDELVDAGAAERRAEDGETTIALTGGLEA